MSEIKKPKCGFGVRKTYEGEKDFDQDYIDIQVKKVVEKIGPGDEDYQIIDKEIVTKRNISDVINSQAQDAGIEAYLRPFVQAGANLPDVNVCENVQDFTEMPDNLADAVDVGHNLQNAFNKLPPDLKGDAKTAEEFFAHFTQEKFDEYIKSKMPKKEVKEDEK